MAAPPPTAADSAKRIIFFRRAACLDFGVSRPLADCSGGAA